VQLRVRGGGHVAPRWACAAPWRGGIAPGPGLLTSALCLLARYVRERGANDWSSKKLVGSLDAPNRYFDFEKLAEVTKGRRPHCARALSPGKGGGGAAAANGMRQGA
jgi:hypothetical protein